MISCYTGTIIISLLQSCPHEYAEYMEQDGMFGGEAEIQALCWLYSVRAKVYMGGLNYAVTSREYGDQKDMQVKALFSYFNRRAIRLLI